jgi:hypothetical protein
LASPLTDKDFKRKLISAELDSFSEFYYQLSVDGLANGSDAFGG